MNVREINERLAVDPGGIESMLSHLVELAAVPYRFNLDFGLSELPEEGGIIAIRGARQYGKSTWLEQELLRTAQTFGAGTAFYLNGDLFPHVDDLEQSIRELLPLYRNSAAVRRLFIDEVTAVKDWHLALKRLADGGALKDILVVTTGSKASDLRHGVERLPGRKGRLARTSYIFTPIEYREFVRVCGSVLGENVLDAYLLTGGSPIACAHITQGRLPEFVIELVKDWVYGACATAGRSRGSLLAVMECLFRFGGTPVGQAKLAREAGLANNTVAAGYIDMLADLMCVSQSFSWVHSRNIKNRRRPCKFHFCNTLAAVAWHPNVIRTLHDFRALSGRMKGAWYEWAVAQELWRRAAIRGDELPEEQAYWSTKEHELDFVVSKGQYLEVKAGKTTPLEFGWFSRSLPGSKLSVLSPSAYETENIRGLTLNDFLLDSDSEATVL